MRSGSSSRPPHDSARCSATVCRSIGRALAALVRACDDGVQARRESFAAQFKAGPASRVPAFLFRSGVAYEAAICFSCGDRLAEVRFGRCWRCALAWRLVAVRVPAATAAALDEARVCA